MASRKARLMAALCSLIILSNFFGSTQSVSCCLNYKNRLPPCSRIKGYTIQTINTSCDINAIILHTHGRRFVCADPSKEWTLRLMKCVHKRSFTG